MMFIFSIETWVVSKFLFSMDIMKFSTTDIWVLLIFWFSILVNSNYFSRTLLSIECGEYEFEYAKVRMFVGYGKDP